MTKQQLKKGVKVTWASKSYGRTYVKTGTIIARVPPNSCPDDAIPRKYKNATLEFELSERNHVSYLVLVENGGRKPKIYRPLVSKLLPVT